MKRRRRRRSRRMRRRRRRRRRRTRRRVNVGRMLVLSKPPCLVDERPVVNGHERLHPLADVAPLLATGAWTRPPFSST